MVVDLPREAGDRARTPLRDPRPAPVNRAEASSWIGRGPARADVAAPDTRADLEGMLATALPSGAATPENCVVRLNEARRALYPRPRVAQQAEAAAEAGPPENRLAAALGGAWRPVGEDHGPLAAFLAESGPGTTAFFLVRPPAPWRPDMAARSAGRGAGAELPRPARPHAFALRNHGGTLYWIETQAPVGARVRDFGAEPPTVPLGARVIVAGPSGRAIPLPGGSVTGGATTVNALVDPSPRARYEGMGGEIEAHEYEVFFPPELAAKIGAENVDLGFTDHYKISTDHAILAGGHRTIIEFVSHPSAVVPGDHGRADRARLLGAIRDGLNRLSAGTRDANGLGANAPGVPLKNLLPGLRLTNYGKNALVRRHVVQGPTLYPHFTVMAAASGQYDLLKLISGRARTDHPVFVAAQRHTVEGLRFGSAFAADFARRLLSVDRAVPPPLLDLLSEHEDVQALRGHLAVLYMQVAAIVHAAHGNDASPKIHTIGVSRTSIWGLAAELSDAVRTFMAASADRITLELRASVESAVGFPRSSLGLTLGERDQRGRTVTVGDYVRQGLAAAPAGFTAKDVVTQTMSHNILTSFVEADRNAAKGLFQGGKARLDPAVGLFEIRAAGPPRLTAAEFADSYVEWEHITRNLYEQAQRRRSPAGAQAAQRQLKLLENVLQSDDSRMIELLALLDDAWRMERLTATGLAVSGIVVPAVTGMASVVSGTHTLASVADLVEALLSFQVLVAGQAPVASDTGRNRIRSLISRSRTLARRMAALLPLTLSYGRHEGDDLLSGERSVVRLLLPHALAVAADTTVGVTVTAPPALANRAAEALRIQAARWSQSLGLAPAAIHVTVAPAAAAADSIAVGLSYSSPSSAGTAAADYSSWFASTSVYPVDASDGMIRGLAAVIEAREAEIRADLRRQAGPDPSPGALEAAHQRGPRLQRLRGSLDEWRGRSGPTGAVSGPRDSGARPAPGEAYVEVENGIAWASSRRSSVDADGAAVPRSERRCVSVAVLSSAGRGRPRSAEVRP